MWAVWHAAPWQRRRLCDAFRVPSKGYLSQSWPAVRALVARLLTSVPNPQVAANEFLGAYC